MKNFDIHEDILGYDYSEENGYAEVKNKVHLSIPEGNLRLLLLNYSDDPSLLFHLKELARVYELVRGGKY